MTQVNQQKTLLGTVTSHDGNKGVVVTIERFLKHPKYRKYIRRSSKVYAHDESGTCRVGDAVQIQPCRPLSKRKTWSVAAIESKSVEGDEK